MRLAPIALAGVFAAAAASAAEPPARPALETTPHSLAGETLSGDALLARRAAFAEAMLGVEKRQLVFAEAAPENVVLEGRFAQGGLVFGRTQPGATVKLDGEAVMVGEDGRFVVGFGRDSALSALLVATMPDGAVERLAIAIEDREFPVQRIDGLDQSRVSGFTEEQLKKIAEDTAKKNAARAKSGAGADWADGFDWPVEGGRVSGVFGSQRILNGEPMRPHSGFDLAAPEGTPIRAPADGIVTLAEHDMYFEGGLVFIDHGHWVESALLHMSRIDVEPGQRVRRGEVVGAVGATGRATGPHLHWGLKWMNVLVDPELILPERTAGTAAAASEAAPE